MTFAARSLSICWRIGRSGRSRFVKECLLYRDGVESNAGYVQARVMRPDQASGICSPDGTTQACGRPSAPGGFNTYLPALPRFGTSPTICSPRSRSAEIDPAANGGNGRLNGSLRRNLAVGLYNREGPLTTHC
jgi:hypothetical protein